VDAAASRQGPPLRRQGAQRRARRRDRYSRRASVLRLCRGGARKPSGYSFLPELEQSQAQQISIEAAQPKLDLKILHELPSKTIVLGVIDLGDMAVETPRIVADRIRRALDVVPPERIVVAPDCGMKYLPCAIAFAKMKAMADGAALLRHELGGN
jgi:5-methyltetrahydropteroyltriglutamate--homocysteine methyltransferase